MNHIDLGCYFMSGVAAGLGMGLALMRRAMGVKGWFPLVDPLVTTLGLLVYILFFLR